MQTNFDGIKYGAVGVNSDSNICIVWCDGFWWILIDFMNDIICIESEDSIHSHTHQKGETHWLVICLKTSKGVTLMSIQSDLRIVFVFFSFGFTIWRKLCETIQVLAIKLTLSECFTLIDSHQYTDLYSLISSQDHWNPTQPIVQSLKRTIIQNIHAFKNSSQCRVYAFYTCARVV